MQESRPQVDRLFNYMSLKRFRAIIFYFACCVIIVAVLNAFIAFKTGAFWIYPLALLIHAVFYFLTVKPLINHTLLKQLFVGAYFVLFQLLLMVQPGQFHVLVYWQALIPFIAILILGKKGFTTWSAITLLTLGIQYGLLSEKEYQVEVDALRFAIGGMFFLIMLYSAGIMFANFQNFSQNRLYKKNRRLYQLEADVRKRNALLLSQQKKLRLQHKQLDKNAKELAKLNEELSTLNEVLEDKVKDRTRKLQQQNEQLKAYAFTNAHKVRGPLSRILGLCLLREDPAFRKAPQQLFGLIEQSAEELDDVVRELNSVLKTRVDVKAMQQAGTDRPQKLRSGRHRNAHKIS